MKDQFSQFLRFCIVGGIAFAIDAAVLELALALGIPNPSLARIISLLTAMQAAYILNLRFTFRHSAGHNARTWGAFMTSNLTGALINYAIFMAVLLWILPDHSRTARVAAIVAGTGIALFFNYWANRRFVFKRKTP
jgi:putative flippase GtrA